MKLYIEAWELMAEDWIPDRMLDLRPVDLWRRGHIPEAESLPYTHFQDLAPERLQTREQVLLIDGAGARAAEMVVWLRQKMIVS